MSAAGVLAAGVTVAAGVAVRARGLGKRIDETVVLEDLTFDVPRGRYVTLLGANGAGKSTLLRVLASLVPASAGELALFGEHVGRASHRHRARIGLIGHGLMLYRDLSAVENLVFFARLYGVAEPRRRAETLLAEIGMSARRDAPVRTLSRGMAQRVAIARALVHDPPLLLADEPFAGLDAPSSRLLEAVLGRLHRDGRTIVLANHDLEQSLRLAEQALVLRGGRLVVDAPTARLDAGALLAEVTGP